MFSSGRSTFAVFLIAIGSIMMLALITGKDTDGLFWPIAFIFVGLWFIFRPKSSLAENMRFRFATEIDEEGEWQVKDEEMFAFAHDVDYDLTDADIPAGETHIRMTGFASDLSLRVPEDVGLAINTNAFSTETKIHGDKQDYVMTGLNYASPNYDTAARKLRFEITSFAVEVKVR